MLLLWSSSRQRIVISSFFGVKWNSNNDNEDENEKKPNKQFFVENSTRKLRILSDCCAYVLSVFSIVYFKIGDPCAYISSSMHNYWQFAPKDVWHTAIHTQRIDFLTNGSMCVTTVCNTVCNALWHTMHHFSMHYFVKNYLGMHYIDLHSQAYGFNWHGEESRQKRNFK